MLSTRSLNMSMMSLPSDRHYKCECWVEAELIVRSNRNFIVHLVGLIKTWSSCSILRLHHNDIVRAGNELPGQAEVSLVQCLNGVTVSTAEQKEGQYNLRIVSLDY